MLGLQYNELSFEDGFYSVDVDEDGVISIADICNASDTLQLDLPHADLQVFLAHIEQVGGGQAGEQQLAGWKQVLEGGDGSTVLKSRGVTVDDDAVAAPHASEGVATSTDMQSVTAAAPSAPIASVGGADTEATETQARVPDASAGAPADTSVAPAAEPATASANTDIAGTEPSAAVPPAVEQVSEEMQPDVVQGVSSEVPSPNLSNREATATEPSPGDSRIPAQADAAAEACAVAEAPLAAAEGAATSTPAVEAVSWDSAAPMTLTLDIDFATIGDHEAFKAEVLADVIAAAQIDPRFVKITSIAAGSVIVHMLVSQDVGAPDSVVQGLVQQMASPDSALRKGRLTGKAKSVVPGPPGHTPADVQASLGLAALELARASTPDLRTAAEVANDKLRTSNDELRARVEELEAALVEAETDKENLSEQLESATFDLQNLRRESLAHVAELEKEAAQIRAELAASQEAAAAVDSVSEVQQLKAQVSSLTFQLQELQGVATTTPRAPSCADVSPAPALGVGSGSSNKKTLAPPPDPSQHLSAGVSRRPSSDEPQAPTSGDGVAVHTRFSRTLENPPDPAAVFSNSEGPGRRSNASSRKTSPERLQGRLSPSSTPVVLSPPASPTNSDGQLKIMTKERDEARAALAAASEELAQLRNRLVQTETAAQQSPRGVPGSAADLESQVGGLVQGVTVAALGERVQELQSELQASALTPRTEAAALRAELDAASSALATAQVELDQLRSTRDAAAAVANAQAAAVSVAGGELEAVALEHGSDVSKGIAILTAEVDKLREEARDKDKLLASLQSELAAAAAAAHHCSGGPTTSLADANQGFTPSVVEDVDGESARQAAEARASALEAEVKVLQEQLAAGKALESLTAEQTDAARATEVDLNSRLAEALAAVAAERSAVTALEEKQAKLLGELQEARDQTTELKKEKSALLNDKLETDAMQRTLGVASAEQLQSLQSRVDAEVQEKKALSDQMHALETQIAEMRGREHSLQEQLARGLQEISQLKDAGAEKESEVQRCSAEIARLGAVERQLETRIKEMEVESVRAGAETEALKRELEDYNGKRYGEVESLQAQLQILKHENEALTLGKSLENLGAAAGKAPLHMHEDADGEHCEVCGSPSKQRADDDARHLGDALGDLQVSSGALSKVEQLITNSMTELERELVRVREEIATSPHRAAVHDARRLTAASDAALPLDSMPSRRNEAAQGLRERLDLLAAALSYNGLAVLSGFSAFDQDRDGRVSLEDLRKSLSDLELELVHQELQALFAFMDADNDGFISEAEWAAALRDADPFAVLASQGVRAMAGEEPVSPLRSAAIGSPIPAQHGGGAALQPFDGESGAEQAMEAFEMMKLELHKSLEAQKRMQVSLDHAARGCFSPSLPSSLLSPLPFALCLIGMCGFF